MKKAVKFLLIIPIVALGLFFILKGFIINNPIANNCEVKEIVVNSIYERGVKDIVFTEVNGDFYYINRGLEQGLNLKGMKEKVLNKTVTLHLANIITGASNHIAQLAMGDEIIFTEFSTSEEKLISSNK